MLRRLCQFTLIATLIVVIGVHWIILQSVAWTGMIIAYSRTASLGDAMEKTFDGKHPCRLCNVVKQGRKAEEKLPPQQKLTLKVDYFCNHERLAVDLPPPFVAPDSGVVHPPIRTEAPPIPPPRSV